MLHSDLIGFRKLFESAPRLYYFGWVRLCVDGEAVLPPFTGKVVKSLLIKANPVLESVFEGKFYPRPVRVSTLAMDLGGRQVYLWKMVGGKNYDKPLIIGPSREYLFYVGFTEDVSHQVTLALTSIDGVELFGVKWFLVEMGIESYRLPTQDVPGELSLDGAEAVKLEFRTPTLLLDPFKESRYKRFLPLPGIVFAYNIGDLLRMQRNREYIEAVNIVNTVLNETYSALETVKPIKYIYEGKQLPGITGYIKYIIDWDLVEKLEIKNFLENLLLHTKIMGVGTSRANGFGHTTIKIIKKS